MPVSKIIPSLFPCERRLGIFLEAITLFFYFHITNAHSIMWETYKMECSNQSELLKHLVAKARRMYNADEIPYEWGDVINIIEADPEVFMACLRRAMRYRLPLGEPKSRKLWISCNMADGYIKRDDCYFCGKVMKREVFLFGNVHLEHFYPRSGGGVHTPGNITLVCRKCNLL